MRYAFRQFEFDPGRLELREDGEIVHTEPQILALLGVLLAAAGETVTKETINKQVWSGRVVSDAALSGRIKALRALLHDDGKRQEVIRTVHRRGFRFVADVTARTPEEAGGASIRPGAVTTRPDRPTVAVLPFANLSTDADQDYFSEGVSTDLIAHLSRHRWLHVIARNTAFSFRQSNLSAAQLGEALGARYVVEGSVQKSGNRVRIRASLTDAQSGYQMWSERYDRELSDIFAVQDEITETIAARLEPEIGFAERDRVVAARPENLQAWDCFHLGVHHFYQFTAESNREAQALLRRSQALDERFGEAWAWWAYAVVLGMVYWDTPASQTLLDEALAACETALKLDPHNATFYALRARTLLARREYDRAIVENEKAIELNPTFAAAYCGLGDSLAYEGRYEEAMPYFERSIALSPNDPQLWAFYSYGALALLFMGDFERAEAWTERALATPNCQFWALAHRAVALAYLGRIPEAESCIAQIRQEVPDFSTSYAKDRMFYLKRSDQIELYLRGLSRAGAGTEPAR
ncbi:MAG: winged helix-turn-helix domain-containing tetratricopeptide repeat protein [Pseudomonadales bacterium]